MVEYIAEASRRQNGPRSPSDQAYVEQEMQANQTTQLLPEQKRKSRQRKLVESELNKLPIHLCRKPNRQMMSEQEFADSFREMMDNRLYLNIDEREAFANVVRQGLPDEHRGQFWNLCTGIHMYQNGYCEGYYQTLHAALQDGSLEKYPNQMFEKFKRDISRAFPEDDFYTDEIKESISRVIEAYIWRNPTVGYIQGFNFLVFRLRKVLNEEDTFWTLVMIIETYMPPDYYVEMYGVRTQATILQKIFRQYSFLPDVQEKFDDPAIKFDLMDSAISWFISIYSQCLPEKASLQVLDLFFLFGKMENRVLFNVALGYLSTLQTQIVSADDLGVLKNEVFTEKNESLENTAKLMLEIKNSMNALKQEHIDFYRPVCQKEAVDQAQEIKHQAYNRFKQTRENYKSDQSGNVERMRKQFLMLFSHFQGDMRDQLKLSYIDPVSTFKCNQKWPMCAFNFSKQHVIPETFTYKSGDYDDIAIYPDYFSEQAIEFQRAEKPRLEQATTVTNIVIERDYHYCKANLFVNTFASLYIHKRKQSRLFKCKQLAIKKNMTQIESHRKMMKFVSFLRDQKLADNERIRMVPVKVIRDPAVIKEERRRELREEKKEQQAALTQAKQNKDSETDSSSISSVEI